jgi:hypothetical protein
MDSLQWTGGWAVDGVTNIDVPELITIGEAVAEVAGRLDRVAGGIANWESAANGAVDGSVTCAGALADAAMHWTGTLAALAAEIRDYGVELHRSAVDYRAADELAARQLRQSGYFADAPGRPAAQ